ncbi:MAG: 5-oxoprolinase subunit PxpA [Balneolaceae bacterium]|nr:5-oxoprolinase subunit PxpA [Balneolaceae bacterium]
MRIDLNCDLGEWKTAESRNNDRKIMPFITSCNIACGGHIGNDESIRSTIQLALEHQVAIGLHPSYPDKEHFGRKVLDIKPAELKKSLIEQIERFKKHADDLNAEIHHVKPHGALYNFAAKDETTAQTILDALIETKLSVPIYTMPNSVLKDMAQELGFTCVNEVFADRAYEDTLELRSRTKPGAVLNDFAEVQEHIHRMILDRAVKTFSGKVLPITAETMCLHSDTAGAIHLAKQIHQYLKDHGCDIAPY